MKKLFFEFIWQWRGGAWIGFNPIGVEFEYDKYEPVMAFKFVVMGVGFQIVLICPWETKESVYAKECLENTWQILSIDQETLKEKLRESEVLEEK